MIVSIFEFNMEKYKLFENIYFIYCNIDLDTLNYFYYII